MLNTVSTYIPTEAPTPSPSQCLPVTRAWGWLGCHPLRHACSCPFQQSPTWERRASNGMGIAPPPQPETSAGWESGHPPHCRFENAQTFCDPRWSRDNRWLHRRRVLVQEEIVTPTLFQLPFSKSPWAKQGSQTSRQNQKKGAAMPTLFRCPWGLRVARRTSRNCKLKTVQMRSLAVILCMELGRTNILVSLWVIYTTKETCCPAKPWLFNQLEIRKSSNLQELGYKAISPRKGHGVQYPLYMCLWRMLGKDKPPREPRGQGSYLCPESTTSCVQEATNTWSPAASEHHKAWVILVGFFFLPFFQWEFLLRLLCLYILPIEGIKW